VVPVPASPSPRRARVVMEELVNSIQEELPSQQRDVYETLSKVLANIVRNPAEPKYRTLKKDNRMVQDKICRSQAAVSLLLALGFEDSGTTYSCPSDASLEQMEEVVELLQCILASQEEEADTSAVPAVVPATELAAAQTAPRSSAKAAQNPHSFARRDDMEKRRDEQANQLEAVRLVQKAQYTDVGSLGASTADASGADVKKKPVRSAFDFESRSKQEQQHQKAVDGLEELRQKQREKFKDFQKDPAARQTEAYQRPAAIAHGGQVEQGWGGWLSGLFGSSSSGSGGGGSGGRRQNQNERPGPQIKGIGDLPKPVRRG